jgi:hypothetical protein
VSLRDCIAGEQFTEDKRCIRCSNGTYLFEKSLNATCKKCQDDAICMGGHIATPKKNYWRSNSTSEIYIKCPKDSICL